MSLACTGGYFLAPASSISADCSVWLPMVGNLVLAMACLLAVELLLPCYQSHGRVTYSINSKLNAIFTTPFSCSKCTVLILTRFSDNYRLTHKLSFYFFGESVTM